MYEREVFSDAVYDEESHVAERELSSFITAVTQLYGPEQARLAAQDWLDESELMDSPPRSEMRHWRAVTIAASARLADRIDVAPLREKSLSASSDTKVSPIPSSNCFSSAFLS
jgi:hypothetical protein